MTYRILTNTLAHMLLVVWSLSLGTANASASQEIDPDYHDACDPKPPVGDKIDDTGAIFYYLSDVEDCGGQYNDLVLRVRNINTNDLIITWTINNTLLVYRSAAYPLPPGVTDDGSYTTRCGYETHTNTTISFTQQPVSKRVRAYVETVPCETTDGAPLRSRIHTSYRDHDGILQDIEVEFRSAISDAALVYEIEKSNSSVDVAVGGLANVISSLKDEQEIKIVRDSIASWADEFDAVTFFTTLDNWEQKGVSTVAIPGDLKTQELLIFDTPTGPAKHYMEWDVARTPFASVMHTTAPLVLLDPFGDVITTRPVGLYIPQVEEFK